MYLEKANHIVGRCDICSKEADEFVVLEVDREPYEYDQCCMCKECVQEAMNLFNQTK